MGRDTRADGDALFFADLPASATSPSPVDPAGERSVYGAGRRPNWGTIALIALLHVTALTALVKFDVIHIAPKSKVLVVDLIAEPPVPPAEKQKPEPVVVEKVQPVVITPPQIVQTLAPPPPSITVSTIPPPPKPVAAPPPPTGPVMVGNLDERLLEGASPRYPTESRRKKEQGTVVLRVTIGTDGRVEQIAVAQSSGFERLDQAALLAARGWRWKPMVRDGEPVEVRGTLTFPFSLT